jgi:hypothetical protein
LQEENEKLKSESHEKSEELRAVEASRGAFCSQVSSLKEANTTRQGDIRSLRAGLVETKDKYKRLLVDLNAEKAALHVQVLDLEVGSESCLVRVELTDTVCEDRCNGVN